MNTPRQIIKKHSEDLPSVDTSLVEKDIIAADVFFSKNENALEAVLDQLALVCNDKTLIDPQWALLAGRLQMENIHRLVPTTFSEATKTMRPILNESYYNFVTDHAKELDEIIRADNDFKFDIFSTSTLRKSYLAHVKRDDQSFLMETPQYMYLRVATFLRKPNMVDIKNVYTSLSNGDYSHATPTLFNAGMIKSQMSSCFLGTVSDDMPGISKSWHDHAIISMNSGGIGCDFSQIRHSEIGQHGFSRGIVPWLKITNEILKTVDQAGKRKGSGTMYLKDWHVDVFEFIELKDEGPEDMRAKDLFLALMISDLFMKRVEADDVWSLFCPNKAKGLVDVYGPAFEDLYLRYEQAGIFSHQVRARELWQHILNMQIKKSAPFLLYADACNLKSNQKNSGIVRCSNLCVSGDTFILTDQGQFPIKDLEGQKVNVWNGEEWSDVTVKKTGTNKNLIKVVLSNGVDIDCTPEHKFYTQTSYHSKKPIEVRAKDLVIGSKLIKWKAPLVEPESPVEFKYPYTHGFYCGDGTDQNRNGNLHPQLALYEEKKSILPYLDYISHGKDLGNKINVVLPKDLASKFEVPMNSDFFTRLLWIAGLCDADGTVARNGKNESIQIGSINKDFLLKVRLLLLTLGVETKVTLMRDAEQHMLPDGFGGEKLYDCQPMFRLLITSGGAQELLELGVEFKRLKIERRSIQRNASQFVTVESLERGPQNVDTFCFTEPKRHMGVFNGVLTGQCTEITLNTSPDEIASCILSSTALNRCVEYNPATGRYFFNFDKLERLVAEQVYNLNKVIDYNYYPDNIPEIKTSNMRHRPLGIGVQGLADAFALLDISWVIPNPGKPINEDDLWVANPKAQKLNDQIFETMYFAAVKASVDLAKTQGPYPSFAGSPASQGQFQFDMWGVKVGDRLSRYTRDQWETLRNEMMKFGLRNSTLMAVMPTASSAHILGNNEACEPFTELIFARSVLAGQFMLVNRHLIRDLNALNIWNDSTIKSIISNRGSMKEISVPESDSRFERIRNLKMKYLTVFEIPQKATLQLTADRGRFICQTQSSNCFMAKPTRTKLNAYHFHAWKLGLKTGMYYLRQKALTDPINFASDTKIIPVGPEAPEPPTKRRKWDPNAVSCNPDGVCMACNV